MERLIRPVSRQLLRPRPRYPFAIPPPVYAKRLYTTGHTVPPVSYYAGGILITGIANIFYSYS